MIIDSSSTSLLMTTILCTFVLGLFDARHYYISTSHTSFLWEKRSCMKTTTSFYVVSIYKCSLRWDYDWEFDDEDDDVFHYRLLHFYNAKMPTTRAALPTPSPQAFRLLLLSFQSSAIAYFPAQWSAKLRQSRHDAYFMRVAASYVVLRPINLLFYYIIIEIRLANTHAAFATKVPRGRPHGTPDVSPLLMKLLMH